MAIITIGIDHAKNVFAVYCVMTHPQDMGPSRLKPRLAQPHPSTGSGRAIL